MWCAPRTMPTPRPQHCAPEPGHATSCSSLFGDGMGRWWRSEHGCGGEGPRGACLTDAQPAERCCTTLDYPARSPVESTKGTPFNTHVNTCSVYTGTGYGACKHTPFPPCTCAGRRPRAEGPRCQTAPPRREWRVRRQPDPGSHPQESHKHHGRACEP